MNSTSQLPLDAKLPAPTGTRDAAVFVWSVWIGMVVAALWFTWNFGSKYPYYDDLGLSLWLSGEFPVTWDWLWEQSNDHRLPLPKLLWILLYRVSGGDFRAAMLFNIVCVAALAAGLICVARRIRGRSSYADAFFVLLLLTWQEKLTLFLWGYILQLTLSTVLVGAVLILIAAEQVPSVGRAVLAGLCIVLLPLCGANGLAFVPVLALWLAVVGLYGLLRQRSVARAGLLLGLSILAVATVVLYYVGFDRAQASSPDLDASTMIRRLGAGATWKSAFAFITMGFGMSNKMVHEYIVEGPYQAFLYAGVTEGTAKTLAHATVGISASALLVLLPLIWLWLSRPAERFRLFGLTSFLAACACLALAIGVGRGGEALVGHYRYIVLATPVFAAVYLVWVLFGGSLGRLVQMSAFVLFCILLPRNMELAWQSAYADRAVMRTFEEKMNAGVPLLLLVDEYVGYFQLADDIGEREILMGSLQLLKKHGGKHYASLRHDDLPIGVRLDVTKPLPAGIYLGSGSHGVWDERLWSGKEPVFTFALPERLKVQPLRLRMMANTFGAQPVDVKLNGGHLTTLHGDGGSPRLIEVDLPPVANVDTKATPGVLREYNRLEFHLSKAHSPQSVGQGEDTRPLGLGVIWMEFIPKPDSR